MKLTSYKNLAKRSNDLVNSLIPADTHVFEILTLSTEMGFVQLQLIDVRCFESSSLI